MGYYRYCEQCNHPLSKPTLFEDLVIGVDCPVCGTEQSQAHTEKEWIVELWMEIEELKKRNKKGGE